MIVRCEIKYLSRVLWEYDYGKEEQEKEWTSGGG